MFGTWNSPNPVLNGSGSSSPVTEADAADILSKSHGTQLRML